MHVHFVQSQTSMNVTFLATEDNKVIGSIIGHCGNWNYHARLLDPATAETRDVAVVDRMLMNKLYDPLYDEMNSEKDDGGLAYSSFGRTERDKEALHEAKIALLAAACEVYPIDRELVEV